MLQIYKLSDISKPFIDRQLSLCDVLKLKVSPLKNSLLVNSISQDTAKNSYYGLSTLYYVDVS